MPVDTRKAAYNAVLPEWRLVRDCMAGESAIKAKTEFYLPVPSALDGITDPVYRAYLKRSRFPDIIAPTVRGLIGALFRRPATVELPPRIDYLIDRATPDGLNLESLAKRLTREILITGRAPLMVDIPMGNITRPRPYLAAFEAETLINWREIINPNGDRLLSLAVLETEEEEESEEDPFEDNQIKRWRVLRLVDGRYEQTIHEQHGMGIDNNPVELEPVTPTRRGVPFDQIPLVVIGSTDIVPDIDEIPLIGLCRTAIGIYQQYADYRQALYMTSQPTPYAIGVNDDDPDRPNTLSSHKPNTIGSGIIWLISNPDAKVGMLEFSGSGVAAQRTAIEDEYGHAIQLGAAMLEQSKRAAEAAESLRLRQSGQSATLHSIASAVGDGIKQALKWSALWADADPEAVVYEPNLDFVETEISPDLLRAIGEGWQSGLYPKSVANFNLRKAEFFQNDKTDEELQDELDQEGEALGMIGMKSRESPRKEEAA